MVDQIRIKYIERKFIKNITALYKNNNYSYTKYIHIIINNDDVFAYDLFTSIYSSIIAAAI